MADDPYSVLGLSKSASDAEIRSAYKRLVKELHPDVNPDDKVSEERFKKVSAAFAILGDKEKRAKFDRGEIDASGQERVQNPFFRQGAGGARQTHFGQGGFADFSEIFGDMFGQTGASTRPRPAENRDIRYRLDVEFMEAAVGAKKRIVLPNGGTLDLNVPAGVADGQTLRLKGKGQPGRGGMPAGDALIEITVLPHQMFERKGLDIWVDLPITVYEAILGAKVEVPTIAGRVSITIPKGSSNGQVLRLKGQGIKVTKGNKVGDQHVRLIVELPKKNDPRLNDLLETWKKKFAYDPRKNS